MAVIPLRARTTERHCSAKASSPLVTMHAAPPHSDQETMTLKFSSSMTPLWYMIGTRMHQLMIAPSITLAATRSPMSAPAATIRKLLSRQMVYLSATGPKMA